MKFARVLAVLVLLSAGSCARFFGIPRSTEAKTYAVPTADGWKVSLVRYPARGRPRGRPVLLCHGISANDRNMDLDEKRSLARWLSAQGRETWALSLRSAGESDRADDTQGRPADFGFDAYWQEDLPAALAFILSHSRADAVDFVGHSMGGMIAYAYLSQGGTGIHAAVTLGSPTRFGWDAKADGLLVEWGSLFISPGGQVPSSLGGQLVIPLEALFDGDPVENFFYNPANTSPEAFRRLLAYGTDSIPGGVAAQMLDLVRTGHFGSRDGARNFRADLSNVQTPVMVVAGRLDRLAPAMAVRDGFRALGGPKEWLMLSEATGSASEYGHMDLLLGDHAPNDVFKPLLEFFERHEKHSP